MNNIFNIKRFGNFFLYDLRNSKNNFTLSLLIIGLMPIIFFTLYELLMLVIGGSLEAGSDVLRITAIAAAIITTCLVAPAKLYGFITDKKAGSDYLMIPASCLEKWLSMILITCLVVPLVLLIILIASDSLLGIIFPTLYGTPYISDLGKINEIFTGAVLETKGLSYNLWWLFFIGWVEDALIFTLGAIYFKKAKVAKTLLVSMLVSIAFSLIFGSLLTGDMSRFGFYSEDGIDAALNIIENTNLYVNLVAGLLIVVLGAGTYLRIKNIKH